MVDAEPDGWVDGQLVEPVGRDPVDVLGLAARRELATHRAGAQADGVLLADLAVVVGDDVAGVGVDADETGDLDVQPGFLANFADGGGGGGGLADVLGAAGDGSQGVVGALDQQHPAGVVEDDGGDHDHEAVGGRSNRVVVVVALGHVSWLPRRGF